MPKKISDLLGGGGATAPQIQQTSSDTTANITSGTITMDASSGNKTITLNPASTYAVGTELVLRKTDSTSNTVTILPNGIETIDGSSSKVLTTEGESYTIQCTGTGWIVVSHNIPTPTSILNLEGMPDIASNPDMILAVNSDGSGLELKHLKKTFTELDDTPDSLSSQQNKMVVVNSAGTALDFADPVTKLTDLDDMPSISGQANKSLKVNATGDGFVLSSSTGGGAAVFTELEDAPTSYTGQQGAYVVVNPAENGLILLNKSSISKSWQTTAEFNEVGATFSSGLQNPIENDSITLLQDRTGFTEHFSSYGSLDFDNCSNIRTTATTIGLIPYLDVGTGADGSPTPWTTTNTISTTYAFSSTISALTSTTATLVNAANTLLQPGDEIALVCLYGINGSVDNVGNFEFLRILSYNNTTKIVTFQRPKTKYYGLTAGMDDNIGTTLGTNSYIFLLRIPNFVDVTINSGGVLRGASPVPIIFRVAGTLTFNGTGYISGGAGVAGTTYGYGGGSLQKPGISIAYNTTTQTTNNYGGGGGGTATKIAGGGGYGTQGINGTTGTTATTAATPGDSYGDADITKLLPGSGGGGGTGGSGQGVGGGGAIYIVANNIVFNAAGTPIKSLGGNAPNATSTGTGGGGGAGGSIFIDAGNITTVAGVNIAATGGTGGNGYSTAAAYGTAGSGGAGRILLRAFNIDNVSNITSIPAANMPAPVAATKYTTSGNVISTNILQNDTITGFGNVTYDLPILPANTNVAIQFSQNGTTWYSATGIQDSSTNLIQGTDQSLDISSLPFTPSSNFYYQLLITGDGSATPLIDRFFLEFFPHRYEMGEQTYTTSYVLNNSLVSFKPSTLTANWILEGTDQIAPKFRVQSSASGSFLGDVISYPSGSYFQAGTANDIQSGVPLDLSSYSLGYSPYWRIEVILNTGTTEMTSWDTPSVTSIKLQGLNFLESPTPRIVTTSTLLVNGDNVTVDTSITTGAVTLTLPASPIPGMAITIMDGGGVAATRNIILAPNGGKINSSTSNLTINVNLSVYDIRWVNATIGWRAIKTA